MFINFCFKKGNRWKKLFVLLFFVIVVFFLVEKNKISYQDDYYEVVNEGWLSKNLLEDGAYTWSMFSEMQDQADEEMEQVFLEVLNSKDLGEESSVFEKIQVVYENAMNVEKRNQEGLGVLSNYVNQLNEVSTISDLVLVISFIEKELGIPIFSNIVVDSDFENTSANMVYLYPVTFPFGTSSDYYVDEDYMTYKAYLKRAMIQLLEVYGYEKEESRVIASQLISFYEEIGAESKSMLELSDVGSYFHKVTVEDLEDVYTHFSVDSYLQEQGIGNLSTYNLVDEGQYRKLNSYLELQYLDLWKSHLLVMILSHYANYLGMDYEQVVLNLNQALTGGEEEKTLEERSREMVVSLFSSEMDSLYEKRLIDEKYREYLYGMFMDIKETYLEMLKGNDWLSKETIGLAIEKLEAMEIFVGLDSVEKDFSALEGMNLLSNNECGNLLKNVLEVIRVRRMMELNRLKSGGLKRAIGESVVNAYYSPMSNAIYIPSAAVFMIDLEANYYENLGKIGMVIAHEITHGFDWNGSQFDLEGNFKNWWSDKDRENFSQLKEEVIEYYNGYEVLNGRFIDGELTVNENIADLGAVRCIGLVAKEKGASSSERKEMYSSFAQFWVSQSSEEYMKLLLLQDTHAPNKYRVNAVLSSSEDFYELYHVSFFDEMYVKKEDRVQVW